MQHKPAPQNPADPSGGSAPAAQPPASLSRRAFLRAFPAAVAGSWLVACRGVQPPAQLSGPLSGSAAPEVLPSPQPPRAATAAPPQEEPLLARFLALSAVLTGVPDLDPVLGRIYLQSLQESTKFAVTVQQLVEQAGFAAASSPNSMDELLATGIFDAEPTRSLADKILEYWYTGVYDTAGGEQAVATFVGSLTWATNVFTKAPTICGAPGFWAERPDLSHPLSAYPLPGRSMGSPNTSSL